MREHSADDSEGKQRDFSSLRALSAGRYDLVVRNGDAEQVRSMLSRAGLLPASPR